MEIVFAAEQPLDWLRLIWLRLLSFGSSKLELLAIQSAKEKVGFASVVTGGPIRLARRARKSRSEVFSTALREYVARHSPDEVTDSVNRVCDKLLEQDDGFVRAAARRTLALSYSKRDSTPSLLSCALVSNTRRASCRAASACLTIDVFSGTTSSFGWSSIPSCARVWFTTKRFAQEPNATPDAQCGTGD